MSLVKKQIQALFNKFGYKLIRVYGEDLADNKRTVQIAPDSTYHAYYHGVDFLCPKDSILSEWVLTGHTWDAHLIDLIERFRPGSGHFTVIEVGSNIGASIVPVIARYPQDNYILVEASPYFVQFLRHNVQSFASDRLEIHNVLLSDTASSVETLIENNTTGGRTRHGPYGVNREYRCTTTTLDNLLASRPISFLKIDTDGFEFPILKGAANLLSQSRPYLLVEFTPGFLRENSENPEDFLNWIMQFGYQHIEVFDNLGHPLGEMSTQDVIELAEHSPNQAGYVDLFFR